MKKKILSLALVAMSLVAFTGMAQKPADTPATCQENVKGNKADRRGKDSRINPFDGLTLTDAQQAQLRQLNDKRKADRQEQAQARKADRQRDDSARLAQRRADKKAYLEEVKAIIGPDQYVVFLENMYINGGNQHKAKAAMGQRKDNKSQADRQGRRDDRGRQHAANHRMPAADTNANGNS